MASEQSQEKNNLSLKPERLKKAEQLFLVQVARQALQHHVLGSGCSTALVNCMPKGAKDGHRSENGTEKAKNKITIFKLTFTKERSKGIFAAHHKEGWWMHCNFTGVYQHCISINVVPSSSRNDGRFTVTW